MDKKTPKSGPIAAHSHDWHESLSPHSGEVKEAPVQVGDWKEIRKSFVSDYRGTSLPEAASRSFAY